MRITVILLTVACIQVSARGFTQSITLQEKNASLQKVLDDIEKQSGVSFVYGQALIAKARQVTISIQNQPLGKVLEQVFKDQPLTYRISDNYVVLSPKLAPLLQPGDTAHPSIDIHGVVMDENGEPLAGANVTVKGTGKGTSTDEKGAFQLKNIDANAILVFSGVNMETIEMKAGGRTNLMVNAKRSISSLDETVVIAYGTTTRRLSTGSVSKITAAEIEQQPVSNPILALEGKAPGLFITQNAGYSGANITVAIRGQNTLNPSGPVYANSPLYIIDGVPFGSSPVEQSVGGFSGAIGFSPLNTINPADIESITVLKDADATAIYGSRGATGVILITTKKGKGGRTKLDAAFSSGFGEVTHTIPMLNTEQFLSVRRQAFANDGVTPTIANAPDLMLWDQKAYTNFPKLLTGNTSHQTNAAFSLSGGDAFTQFLFGGNYRRESTVFATNTSDKAMQFHLSVQHKSHDDKFGATVSVNYNLDNNTIPNYTLSAVNYGLPPNYPLYNADGSLYFGTGYTNPLAAFNANTNMQSANLIASAGFHYTLLPGLVFRANAGYNNNNVIGAVITPSNASNPLLNTTPQAVLNNNYIKTYIAEPQLNYAYTLGKGRLSALIGGSWQETQTIQPYFLLGTFTNIQLATSLGALTILAKSSGYSDYKYESGFGRLEYEWDEKYLVSGNIRRDGSSRFGPGRQFGTFGSAAAAWIFSKENFVKNNLPWLSFGKIKTSYGTVGNDKIPDYTFEAIYNTGGTYGPLTSLLPLNIANPYVQWEVTKKADAAIELGFLKDRLFFSADFYLNRSGNLLGSTTLPSQDGFSSYNSNLPATVQNKGVELELTTTNIKSKNLTWSTSANLTIPQNKLVSFPNLLNSVYANTYVEGQSLNLRTVFHSTGIQNGIATAEDVNHDGALTRGIAANGKGDYIIDGNTDPKFYGGLNNTIRYKGFQIDILFQGVKRTATRGDLNFAGYPGKTYNIPVSMLDVPLKYSAAAGSAASNAYTYFTGSDAAVEDASFIRLKNVSLAYHVPAIWAKRLKMVSLQVYVHAQNLLTITKYKGLDPETLTNNLPPLKMMIAGIQATF